MDIVNQCIELLVAMAATDTWTCVTDPQPRTLGHPRSANPAPCPTHSRLPGPQRDRCAHAHVHQSVANVWRKNAFRNLLDGYHMFSTTKTVDDEMLLKSLETFNEAVGFTVASGVPKPVLVTDLMQVCMAVHGRACGQSVESAASASQQINDSLSSGSSDEFPASPSRSHDNSEEEVQQILA